MRTGKLLERGFSFAKMEQGDTGPDAMTLGPSCGKWPWAPT